MAQPDLIIINGLPGTGSSTVAGLLAEQLGFEYVYAGGIFRAMAKGEGKPLEQFMTELADQPERERQVDQQLLARAEQGRAIIESRVLPWLLPATTPAFKVWLTCQLDERVRRVTQRDATADARRLMQQREAVDAKRYAALYQIDLTDQSVFDLVLDTTKIPAAEVARQIVAACRATD